MSDEIQDAREVSARLAVALDSKRLPRPRPAARFNAMPINCGMRNSRIDAPRDQRFPRRSPLVN